MSSSNKEFYCPYYLSNGMQPYCIRCSAEDGEKNNRIMLPDFDSWKRFALRFCASPHGWSFCSVAQIYQSYYEERNDENNQEE